IWRRRETASSGETLPSRTCSSSLRRAEGCIVCLSLPHLEVNCCWLLLRCGCEQTHDFLQRSLIFHVNRSLGTIDLAHESGENAARADFDECVRAQLDQLANATQPLHSAGHLRNQCSARSFRFGFRLRINVADDRDLGSIEYDLLEILCKTVLCRLHEGAMEWCAHGQHDGSLRATFFSQIGRALHSRGGSGNDDLLR